MSDKIPAKWTQFGHTRIDDILTFDLRSQSICVVEMYGTPAIAIARYQLPTTPYMQHRVANASCQ